MAALFEHARNTGATMIVGEDLPTPKNSVVADLYPRLGFTATGDGMFEMPVDKGFSAPGFVTVRSSFGNQ